jgi:hypothetical protein
MVQEEVKYGWYSAKQARLTGTVQYNRPAGWPSGNAHVVVTEVTPTQDRSGNHWDDLQFVGEVTTYVHGSKVYGQNEVALKDRL